MFEGEDDLVDGIHRRLAGGEFLDGSLADTIECEAGGDGEYSTPYLERCAIVVVHPGSVIPQTRLQFRLESGDGRTRSRSVVEDYLALQG